MVFVDEFEYEDEAQVRSVLDYAVEIKKLPESQQNYVGKRESEGGSSRLKPVSPSF